MAPVNAKIPKVQPAEPSIRVTASRTSIAVTGSASYPPSSRGQPKRSKRVLRRASTVGSSRRPGFSDCGACSVRIGATASTSASSSSRSDSSDSMPLSSRRGLGSGTTRTSAPLPDADRRATLRVQSAGADALWHDDIYRWSQHFCCQLRHTRKIAAGEPKFENDVAPFDVTEIVKPLPECVKPGIFVGSGLRHDADAQDLRRRLLGGSMLGRQQHSGKPSDDDAAPSHLITDPERTDYGARLKKLRCAITLVAERFDHRNSHQLWRQMISFRSLTHQRDRSKARLGSDPPIRLGTMERPLSALPRRWSVPRRRTAVHPSRTLVALASSCLRRPLGVSVAGSSPRRQRTLGYAREWTVKKSMKGYGHLPRIEPAPRAASHARYAPRRDFLDPELGAEK